MQITSLEHAGSLELDGAAVTLGQVISKADIDAGDLTFLSPPGAVGAAYDNFSFKVHDGTEYSLTEYTITVDINPNTTALWLTTDAAASGTPGLTAWAGGDVVELGGPGLALEPGTTAGTFSGIVNFDTFLAGAKPDALHYVTRDITVGDTTQIALYAGDLLFSTVSDGTLTSSNSLAVQDEDLIIFRPDVVGDYSNGMFYTLIDYTDINTGDRLGWTLVEQETTVGSTVLAAGELLYTKNGSPDIYRFVPDEVGDTTSASIDAVLIQGSDIGITQAINGIELIEEDVTIGGKLLTSGQILASIEVDSPVGDNTLGVKHQDIFLLNVTATEPGTTAATATLLMEGADVGLSDASENVTGLTLFGQPLSSNATLVVDTTDDLSDGDTSSINALLATKGADGFISLREAIEAANNTLNAGGQPDRIHFNISTADSGYVDPDMTPGNGDEYWTIAVDAVGLPYLLDPVVLDATTQPGYSGNPVIELDGSATPDAGGINGIALRTNDSTVRGFIVHSFGDEGIEVDGSTGFGDNNTIQNNWVGIDAEGNIASNYEHNVLIAVDASGNRIGGVGPNEGNVIAGSRPGFDGVNIRSNSDDNIVQGNLIGVLADGTTPAGNGRDGVRVELSSDGNLIGGTDPGAGNLITANAGDGVNIDGTTNGTYTTFVTGTSVVGNTIYGNTGAGIDLNGDGVTANDSTDGDGGPNELLNYPLITTANLTNTTLTLGGSLDTDVATAQFRLEFFGNTSGTEDPTNGESRTYLGSTIVVTDGSGDANFSDVTLPGVTLGIGDFVTATATQIEDPGQVGIDDLLAYGSTSEFAVNQAIAAGNQVPTDIQVVSTNEGALSINADGGNDVYFVADNGYGLAADLSTVTVEVSFSVTTPGIDLTPLLSYADGATDEELGIVHQEHRPHLVPRRFQWFAIPEHCGRLYPVVRWRATPRRCELGCVYRRGRFLR